MATLFPKLSVYVPPKVKAAVVPHVPPVFLKMKAFLALSAPTIANSDDMATLFPNIPFPVFLSKVKAAVVPHVSSPLLYLKMKAFLAPTAPTIANSPDIATLFPKYVYSPKFSSKVKAAVVPHVPPVYSKMKALLNEFEGAPTIANFPDMATSVPK